MIYRFIFFLCLQCFAVAAFAQPVNLVPNGGFEERVECIYNDGILSDAPPWFNPMDPEYVDQATPDVFHACAIIVEDPCPYPEDANTNAWLYGVPTNFLGCEDPYEGEGYVGAFFFIPNIDNQLDGYREYLAVRLTEPLQAGMVYDVSMKVSLAERTTHAIWNIQVLFSPDSLVQETTQYMDYEPQLGGTLGEYIDNREGWTELSWSYAAEGGEEFMYIGNFQPDSETDTIEVIDWQLWHYENSAYYFIDDVKVITQTLSNHDESFDFVINCFPNPVATMLTVELKEGSVGSWTFELLSIDGRILSRGRKSGTRAQIDFTDFKQGLYILKLEKSPGHIETKKIFKR